jgi:hypothetical protein
VEPAVGVEPLAGVAPVVSVGAAAFKKAIVRCRRSILRFRSFWNLARSPFLRDIRNLR